MGDDFQTGDHLSDEQIIQIVLPADGHGEDDGDDDDDDNDDVPELPPLSLSGAKKSLESTLRCFESHQGFGEEEIDSICKLIKHVATVQKKPSYKPFFFLIFQRLNFRLYGHCQFMYIYLYTCDFLLSLYTCALLSIRMVYKYELD